MALCLQGQGNMWGMISREIQALLLLAPVVFGAMD